MYTSVNILYSVNKELNWDRTCLVFCFLGCVVNFQASEAIKQLAEKGELESWQSSLCGFFFLSFFLFFFFSFLLLAFFSFTFR